MDSKQVKTVAMTTVKVAAIAFMAIAAQLLKANQQRR